MQVVAKEDVQQKVEEVAPIVEEKVDTNQIEMGKALPAALVNEMEKLSNSLIEGRKSMKAPANYINKNDLDHFVGADKIVQNAGQEFDTNSFSDSKLLLSGDNEGTLTLHDRESKKNISQFKPFKSSSSILICKFVPLAQEEALAFVCNANGESAVFNLVSQKCHYKITCHKGVSDISFHPIKKLALLGSLDGTWSFHDLLDGKILGQY